MRTEQEMMDLILGVAERDECVRAVVMNGSRANPRAPRDAYQDYDIVYLVTDLGAFANDDSWIDVFGERMIMQMPEADSSVVYLMQFTDGNRIDLTLAPVSEKHAYCTEDKLTIVLLDKDGSLPALPLPTDEDHWVKPPPARAYGDCCNELASMGKCRKYLQAHLPEERWQALLLTYADGSYDATWDALFAACKLFRQTARFVGTHFGYEYPAEDDRRVSEHLERVRGWAEHIAERCR